MTEVTADYVEETASRKVAAVPLGHLSIELGHLYMEDFAAGPDRLKELFLQVVPWARTAREVCGLALRTMSERVSTCFLVDDYFSELNPPHEVVPKLIAAADAVGLEIDYLVRESACAVAGDVDLARLVEARLVDDPPPGTTGHRPPPTKSGWLCNGERTPEQTRVAFGQSVPWRPPSENAANRHSIFVDVQLWDELPGGRRWSCPYLAAVWQLLRLGMLRYDGRAVAEPVMVRGSHADSWAEQPAVTQLTEKAAPFAAYRTFSVLAARFLSIEVAVRTILSQYAVEPAVADQVAGRAQGEGLLLPPSIVERIEYVFLGSSSAD